MTTDTTYGLQDQRDVFDITIETFCVTQYGGSPLGASRVDLLWAWINLSKVIDFPVVRSSLDKEPDREFRFSRYGGDSFILSKLLIRPPIVSVERYVITPTSV